MFGSVYATRYVPRANVQAACDTVLYVGLYQLWFARGYQEFAGMESSVTTKVYSKSCIIWTNGTVSSYWSSEFMNINLPWPYGLYFAIHNILY